MKGSKGLRRQDELRRKYEKSKQGKPQEQKEAEFNASASSAPMARVKANIQEITEERWKKESNAKTFDFVSPYKRDEAMLTRDKKADATFHERNPNFVRDGGAGTVFKDVPRILAAQFEAGRGEGSLDLHGQHLKDSKDVVSSALEELQKVSRKRGGANFTLRLVVGRGIHSSDSKPVLKPNIEKLLTQRRIKWTEQEYGGELVVNISCP